MSPKFDPASHTHLAEHVRRALHATGYAELREVKIGVDDEGILSLSGTVDRHFLKQVAQAAAMSVIASRGLRNELQVRRDVALT